MRFLAMLLLALPPALVAQPGQSKPVMASNLVAGGALLPRAVRERPLALAETPTASSVRSFYGWSIALLAISSAGDTASGWGHPEANPILGSTFGAGSVAIKLGLLGSCLVMQHLTLRRHPERRRQVSFMNIGVAGGLAAIAGRNIGMR